MSGPASGIPHILPISTTLSGLANNFASLESIAGRVIATSNGLVVQAGQFRIPLEAGMGLSAGQHVDVRVVRDGARLQWQITARPGGEPAPVTTSNLSGSVQRVLDALGLTSSQWRTLAANLVPSNLPLDQAILQQVITLYAQPARLGSAFQMVTRLVNEAVAAGVPLGDAAKVIMEIAQRMERGTTESFRALIRQAFPLRGRSMAAVLAGLADIPKGNALPMVQEDLRLLIGQLLKDDAFTEFLKSSDKTDVFRRAAEGVLDRITAGELNSARNLQMPYLFAELPLPDDGQLRHLHIHILGEGNGKDGSPESHTVVLDIETSRLGKMWIHLLHAPGTCRCVIKAQESETVALLEQHGPRLVDALNTLGYPDASVKSESWDGDRIAQASRLLRRFSVLDEKV